MALIKIAILIAYLNAEAPKLTTKTNALRPNATTEEPRFKIAETAIYKS